MLDIELIRERPQQVKDALQTVNADPACVDTDSHWMFSDVRY